MVAQLSDELVRRGSSVTLFAAPGSRSAAIVRSPLSLTHEQAIGAALYEADHVARAFADIDAARDGGDAFDVIHDHCGFTALAMADRLHTPMVHTIHGAFGRETVAFYAAHGHRAAIVGISRAQLDGAPGALRDAVVVPNPIDVDRWPLGLEKDGYLLWIGRMDEVKGPHRAIQVARRAGRPLVIAGPIQPGQAAFFERQVRPHIDGRRVRFVGEVGGSEKVELFARAAALLMPISWSEPFGMVMVEALACGTPVLAFSRGAATEIVIDGTNGFLVSDEAGMAGAVAALDEIDPRQCRASVASRYDIIAVVDAYEQVYRAQASAQLARERIIDRSTAPRVRPGDPAPAVT